MEEKLNIILLGKAGSGKGTQAKFLEKKFNLHHISIGDVMRRHVKENTEYGKLIKQCQEKGELVSDDIAVKVLEEETELVKSQNKNLNGFIFDGFPRTVKQAKLLGQTIDLEKTIAINFNISNKVAIQRIRSRAKNESKNGRPARKDDLNADTIQKRLDIYCEHCGKIKTFLEEKLTEDRFIEIDVEEKNEKQVSTELYKKLAKQITRLKRRIKILKKFNKQFKSAKLNGAIVEINNSYERYSQVK